MIKYTIGNDAVASFNRTFMELKSHRQLVYISTTDCFNRTFMELKLQAWLFVFCRAQ